MVPNWRDRLWCDAATRRGEAFLNSAAVPKAVPEFARLHHRGHSSARRRRSRVTPHRSLLQTKKHRSMPSVGCGPLCSLRPLWFQSGGEARQPRCTTGGAGVTAARSDGVRAWRRIAVCYKTKKTPIDAICRVRASVLPAPSEVKSAVDVQRRALLCGVILRPHAPEAVPTAREGLGH